MGFDRPEPAYVPLGCERTFDGQNGLDCRKPVKMMVQVFIKIVIGLLMIKVGLNVGSR